MAILSLVLEVQNSGILVPPSDFVGAAMYDIKELLEGASYIADIPILIKIAKNILHKSNYKFVPRFCFYVNGCIYRISSACWIASIFWSFSKPFRDWLIRTQIVMNLTEEEAFLRKCTEQVQHWQETLRQDVNMETLRQEVSKFCGEILCRLKNFERVKKTEEAQRIIQAFEEFAKEIKLSLQGICMKNHLTPNILSK